MHVNFQNTFACNSIFTVTFSSKHLTYAEWKEYINIPIYLQFIPNVDRILRAQMAIVLLLESLDHISYLFVSYNVLIHLNEILINHSLVLLHEVLLSFEKHPDYNFLQLLQHVCFDWVKKFCRSNMLQKIKISLLYKIEFTYLVNTSWNVTWHKEWFNYVCFIPSYLLQLNKRDNPFIINI